MDRNVAKFAAGGKKRGRRPANATQTTIVGTGLIAVRELDYRTAFRCGPFDALERGDIDADPLNALKKLRLPEFKPP